MTKSYYKQLVTALTGVAVAVGTAALARADDATAYVQPYEDHVLAALAVVPGGLTSDAAAAAAVRVAPQIEVRRAELEAARARIRRTGALYIPSVQVTGSVTRASAADYDFASAGFSVGALNPGALVVGACPDGGGANCVVDSAGEPVGAVAIEPFATPRTTYSLVLDLRVPLTQYALSLPHTRRAAVTEEASAKYRIEAEQLQVALEARVAYYDWLRAVGQVAVTAEAVNSATARLDDARLQLSAGTIPPADVAQFESALAAARIAAADAGSFEQLARDNLALMMGVRAPAFTIGEDVLAAVPGIEGLGTLDVLIEYGQTHRASVRALEQASRTSRLAAKGMRSNMYPSVEAIANLTYANPNQQFFPPEQEWNASWFVGLAVTWGLDKHFVARGDVAELEANANVVDARLAALRRTIAIEVQRAWQKWRRATVAVELGAADLEAAEAAYAQRLTLLLGGEATATELMEAELQRFNATLRAINGLVDLRIARAQLLHASGHMGVAP